MHPYLTAEIAAEHRGELIRGAASTRLVAEARRRRTEDDQGTPRRLGRQLRCAAMALRARVVNRRALDGDAISTL
jgi:hypothetical protein